MNGAYKRTDTTKLAVSALCLALTVAALVGASLIPGTDFLCHRRTVFRCRYNGKRIKGRSASICGGAHSVVYTGA